MNNPGPDILKQTMIDRIKRYDDLIESYIAGQCMDENSLYYGGLMNLETGFTEPARGATFAGILLYRYCNVHSRYYDSEFFLNRVLLSLNYTFTRFHSDNTYDMTTTNPHDPTSVAFSTRALGPAFKLLKKHIEKKETPSDTEIRIHNRIIEFFTKASDGIPKNGFHTPNHRWVITSALSLIMNILDMPELMDEINLYLAEGIDCDEYGEYSERSISIYNLTNNESLIVMAHELGRPDFLVHVRRNLYMTIKYLEPDGTLFTLNSTRQDFGEKTYPFTLFAMYYVMAHIDNNSDFAFIANLIHNMASTNPYDINDQGYYSVIGKDLHYIDYAHEYGNIVPVKEFDFTHFDTLFPNSDIARVRNGDTCLTVMAKKAIAMKYQYKFLGLYMMFLSEDYMIFEKIEKSDTGYILYGQDYKTQVTVNFEMLQNGAKITVSAQCEMPYPCSVLLMFDKEGLLNSEQYSLKARYGNSIIAKNGKFGYSHKIKYHPYTMKVTTDFAGDEHSDLSVNNAIPSDKKAFTVFLTEQAPFVKEIIIENS